MDNDVNFNLPLSEVIIDDYWATQKEYINLIASSCYPYPKVMELQCIPLQTLPIEGLPENRYFPAYKCMDEIEIHSEQLILNLFKDTNDYSASIQPHSGTQANQIVYNAILDENDIILSMGANEGGHISHTRIAGKKATVINYGLDNQGYINYDEIDKLARKYRPKLIISGASSYSREINFPVLHQIAQKYNSLLMADICHTAVFIMADIHVNVFPYADFVTFTVDKNLRGPQGGIVVYNKKYHKEIRRSIFPVSQGGPIQSMLIAKLALFEILNNNNGHLRIYANNLIENSRAFSSFLIQNGLEVVTGGTDTHFVLIDLTNIGVNGAEAEKILFDNKILVNKNLIPYDKNTPLKPSGIRIGITCVTNLDYNVEDIEILANEISNIIIKKNINLSQQIIEGLIYKYQSTYFLS